MSGRFIKIMKICFLANQLSFKDGWGRYSINLLEQLIKRDIKAFILLSQDSQENCLPQIESHKLLPPLFVKRTDKIFSLIRNYRDIKKLTQSADIIHSLIEPYGPVAYLVNRKKPIIITCHGTYAVYPFRKKISSLVYRRVYKSSEKIVCVSRFTQNEILKKVKLRNTLVINNGVDYEKFQVNFQDSFPKERTILSVGALMPRKGYHISIPAVAKVKEVYPDLKYIIVGNQENKNYFGYLQKIVGDYNLKDTVEFLSKISDDDLVKMYHLSDLFLLTPINIDDDKFEGFGQVFLEAGACGRAVVATGGSGTEDAIDDGYNGVLVPQNDIEGTSREILRILNDPGLGRELGANGKKKAQERDWPNVADEYMQLYQSILKNRCNR